MSQHSANPHKFSIFWLHIVQRFYFDDFAKMSHADFMRVCALCRIGPKFINCHTNRTTNEVNIIISHISHMHV